MNILSPLSRYTGEYFVLSGKTIVIKIVAKISDIWYN